MRSYILAIAVATLLAAIYAFQNTAEISVRFFMFEMNFPQGVWEAILFSCGAVLMWFFSILASFEMYSKSRKITMDLNKRIEDLEEEKKSLMEVLRNISPVYGNASQPFRSSSTPSLEKTSSPDDSDSSCAALNELSPSDEPEKEKEGTVSV
ncbi:MAG: LapA family protein [Synergistaceae bacterium]|jgi:uncharacterized integral membrane protein|nr:LapA family protein [Synergistaceae bacterium]